MKVHKNFPKEGVDFLDINPDLNDYSKLLDMKSRLLESITSEELDLGPIDKVVAVESRGFIFGMDIASTLKSGLVLARKPGKLPGNIISENFSTEYSTDKIEVQVDSIERGDRVIIHDDVLATGGTALAVKTLVEKLGATVIGFSFLVEIDALKGKDSLYGSKVISLIHV